MTDRTTRIEQRLRERLGAERVEIADESAQHAGHAGAQSGAGHYALTVVSAKFNGLNAVQRHRLVYDALDELMRTEIHALRIRALTPGEN